MTVTHIEPNRVAVEGGRKKSGEKDKRVKNPKIKKSINLS